MHPKTKPHLDFAELEVPERKTKIWEVAGYEGVFLGTVTWSGAWRQYVFNPQRGSTIVIWSHDCLEELRDFLKWETDQHRLNLRVERERRK